MRRPAEAEAAIRKAIALGNAPARYYDRLGACLSELSRNGEAISAYQQALSLDPNDTHALLRLGSCYYHAEAYREAVVPLEKYVAAKPKDFYGFYYLGHSHFELRQFSQAARALQVAHELNPDDGLTRLGLCWSYVATGQFEKAYGLYPFLLPAGGSLLVLGYVVGLGWLLVLSFKRRGNVAPPVIATLPGGGCLQPQPPGDCRTPPPALPSALPPVIVSGACDPTSSGVGRGVPTAPRASEDVRAAPVLAASHGAVAPPRATFNSADDLGNTLSKSDCANAWPGVWFSLGWLGLFIAGQAACAFLLGLFAPFRGVAAALAGMGAASLPLVIAAGTGFPRQRWGAPFAWPRPFPPVRILMLSLVGLISIQLFQAGYSWLVEWITRKPFPVQVAVPLIQEALQTNPISVVISIVFFAPMAEEVLFRGLLFGALQKWLSARWTIFLTAAMFALIHMQVIYFFPIFLVGLLCGWARHRSGSLAVPMLLHILNNGISLLLMQLFPEAT